MAASTAEAPGVIGCLIPAKAFEIRPTRYLGYATTLLGVLSKQMPKRSIPGSTLMITQSFLHNAICFTSG